MEQISIFDMNRIPAQNHSTTSIAAAEKIAPKRLILQAQVLQYLRGFPDGLTDLEMQEGLDLEGSTQRPRRVELVEQGKVKDSGTTRKTKKGRAATVWVSVR